MIIGACGYADTGSGAVFALLKEFDTNFCFDKTEFLIVHNPDGIEDLKFQLFDHTTKYTSSTVAIERFRRAAYFILNSKFNDINIKKKNSKIVEDYIRSITQVRWNGSGFVDNQLYAGRFYKIKNFDYYQKKINKLLYKLKIIKLDEYHAIWPYHEMNLSIKPEEFYPKTHKFINNIFINYGIDLNKKIVLDQPFCGNDPSRSFEFFGDDCKAIVVDRDPRDLYVHFRYFQSKNFINLYEPIADVKKFVIYYKTLRNCIPKTENPKNVLRINLEQLIYDYEKTTKRIISFCELEEAHWIDKKKYFDPSKSIANTQLFKRFPQYKEEISYISNELKNFLFPYEKYGEVETNGIIMFE